MTPHAAVIGGQDAKNAPPGRADQGHGVTSTGTLWPGRGERNGHGTDQEIIPGNC